MAKNDPQTRVRLPQSVKDWLADSAERNYRSLNAEIVFWLETAKRDFQQPRPHGGGQPVVERQA